MKYGLLIYKDTDNIGDDIQSYAASQFLPHIDYFIDRENMMNFVSDDGKQVKTIMNAWYIHDKYRFDFSPFIYPLFVSMHLKKFPYVDGLTIGSTYITNQTQNTLRKYGPVGARDINTKKLLDNLDIPNYFSGCLTLTIKKFKNVKKSDYICAVNISDKELKILKTKTSKKIITINQDIERGSLSELSWEERKSKVIELLKLYQGAEFVVTTKLHCALPCLALETSVLVLYDKYFDDRMKTFKKFFNYVDRHNFKDIDITKIKNPKLYLQLRNSLIKVVKNFVNEEVNLMKYDIKTYDLVKKTYGDKINLLEKNINTISKKYVKECKKSENKDKMIKSIINQYEEKTKIDYENYKTTIEKFAKEKEIDYNNHKQAIERLEIDKQNLSDELNKIYSSKSWKLIAHLRRIIHGGRN